MEGERERERLPKKSHLASYFYGLGGAFSSQVAKVQAKFACAARESVRLAANATGAANHGDAALGQIGAFL